MWQCVAMCGNGSPSPFSLDGILKPSVCKFPAGTDQLFPMTLLLAGSCCSVHYWWPSAGLSLTTFKCLSRREWSDQNTRTHSRQSTTYPTWHLRVVFSCKQTQRYGRCCVYCCYQCRGKYWGPCFHQGIQFYPVWHSFVLRCVGERKMAASSVHEHDHNNVKQV